MRWTTIIITGFLGLLTISCSSQAPLTEQTGPNVVLIVADDMGYSDLGCFGSEISTPNIDALAASGQIFTNFYAAATCSPTRAMLLTGTDNHVAGLGNMAEPMSQIPQQLGKPGYEGFLNDRVVPIAQLMKENGYHTFIAGKWHLGLVPEQSPTAKGFERSFTLMDAATNHFYPYRDNRFWGDGEYTTYPDGQFSTNVYTDKLIQFIEEKQDNNPFFIYAAYTAPHWPLQAPDNYLDKYAGKYKMGYDSLRRLRFNNLKAKGMVPQTTKLPTLPRVEGDLYHVSDRPLKPWKDLSPNEQLLEAKKMEIYAAMVNNLDDNIGRLVNHLKSIGEFDNTLFLFMSDNGAAVLNYVSTPEGQPVLDMMGTGNSFVAYGSAWAHASSAAFSLYKGYATEGGIRTPMIIKMPGQTQAKEHSKELVTVMDIAPTLLEIAGGSYPASRNGQQVAPLQGQSILPYLEEERDFTHTKEYYVGWELFGRAAIRKGPWKITLVEPPFGSVDFQLFNLEEDPSETTDLKDKFPDKYQELLNHWNSYVKDNGVLLVDW